MELIINDRMTKRIAVICYFIIATLFLLVRAMQGLSFLDIGMYMSGYEHFNEDPISIYYVGQWLMSFEFSGWILKLFSFDSYYGLRIMRTVLVIAMEIIIYLHLKHYMPKRYVLLGLAIATIAQQESYADINYNDYSAFFLCLSLLLFHRGMASSNLKRLSFFLSGLVVGLSIFFRMTNISFLTIPLCALIVLPLVGCRKPSLGSFSLFYSGSVVGVALMLLVIYFTGTWQALMMTITDLFSIGTRTDDPHNFKNVFLWLYDMYKHEVQAGAIVLFITAVYAVLHYRFKQYFMRVGLFIGFAFLIWLNVYLHEHISDVIVGLSWFMMFYLIARPSHHHELKSLFAITFLFPILLPIGTNGGSIFIGQDLVFLPLPVTLYILTLIIKVEQNVYISKFRLLPVAMLVCLVFTFLYTDIKRPMSEEGYRLICRYKVDSPLTDHIYTTKENADTLNYLIKSLRGKYLDNDYLFCNFNIPMVSLLDCKPYAVFSTVFCSTYMSIHYLSVAENHLHRLPCLLLEPGNMSERDKELVAYVKTRAKYRRVWSDGRFELLKPIK